MVINSTIQKSPAEAVHTFIYSEGIDWSSISMPEVSNNSVQLWLLILQPSFITLTVVCWYACAQLCRPSFILLGLCHHKPQELIFSAGFVVKPLAAAALGVSSPHPHHPTPPTPLIEGASSSSRASLNPEQRLKAPVFLRVRRCRGGGRRGRDAFHSPKHTQLWSSLCSN